MAGITELSELQRAALQGIQIGDLIYVEKVFVPVYNGDGEGDEDNEDDSDSESEGGEGAEDSTEQAAGDESHDGENEQNQGDDEDSISQSGNESSDRSVANASSHTSLSDISATPPRVYAVSHITTDTNDSIVDLQLSHLQYSHKTSADATGHTYQIYGKKVVHQHPPTCGKDCPNTSRIIDIATDETFRLTVRPTGDVVRYTDPTFRTANPHTRCITGCINGYLQSMQDLVDMIADYDPPVLSTGVSVPAWLQPTVCPVCIGDELCKKQQELQATFLLTAVPDVGAIVEFLGDLNQRRRFELGYSFQQFDEREW